MYNYIISARIFCLRVIPSCIKYNLLDNNETSEKIYYISVF